MKLLQGHKLSHFLLLLAIAFQGTVSGYRVSHPELNFKKVDNNGNIIAGAVFDYHLCTKKAENDEYCTSLNEALFAQNITSHGLSRDFAENIEQVATNNTSCAKEGGKRQILTITETSAPEGHNALSGSAVLCRMVNGWQASSLPTGYSFDAVSKTLIITNSRTSTNTLGTPATPPVIDPCGTNNATWSQYTNTDTIRWNLENNGELIATAAEGYVFSGGENTYNYGIAPETNTDSCNNNVLNFKKVDTEGNIIAGASFHGEVCNKIGEEKICQSLTDYSWFRDDLPRVGYTNQFTNEIEQRENSETSCDSNSGETVTVTEISAPEGYKALSGSAALCRTVNGWQASSLPTGYNFDAVSKTLIITNNPLPQAISTPATPPVTDPCGTNNATWSQYTNTDTIRWNLENNGELIATAAEGYVFSGGENTYNYGIAPETNTDSCNKTISGSSGGSRKPQKKTQETLLDTGNTPTEEKVEPTEEKVEPTEEKVEPTEEVITTKQTELLKVGGETKPKITATVKRKRPQTTNQTMLLDTGASTQKAAITGASTQKAIMPHIMIIIFLSMGIIRNNRKTHK